MSDYPANPVSMYTALRDDPDSTTSTHIGVFSDEGLARDGCQEDADEEAEVYGTPKTQLSWQDDRSHPLPDGGFYTVILTTLDVRTGMG